MRIAIVGAGAIGGMLTALLTRAGEDPLLIARGETLARIHAGGIDFQEGETRFTITPRVTDATDGVGEQDLVVIAVKAHQIESALPAMRPLIGPETRILTAINGVPWWYFQGIGGEWDGRVLHRVDPTGALAAAFDPHRIIGCAVYLAAEVHAPYRVESAGVRKMIVGAISGGNDAFLSRLSATFEKAELPMPVVPDIRAEVMNKLMGNLWANPLSVIVDGTMAQMTQDPGVCDIGRKMMAEFEAVCGGLNVALPITIEKRLAGAARLGAFRTSMLQDADRGRQIELEAILGSVIEIADILTIPVETMRMVYSLTRLKATLADCYVAPPDLSPLAVTART